MSTQVTEQETEAETEAEPETEAESTHQQRRLTAKHDRVDMRQRAEEELSETDETVTLKVFRFDPEVEGKSDPRFDTFSVTVSSVSDSSSSARCRMSARS